MSDTKLISRRKALARISALALGAYVAPTALTISKAHAKKGSSGGGGGGSTGGGSTGGGSTSGSTGGGSTSGSSTSGSSTSGSSTSGSKTLMDMFSKKKRKRK